MKATWQGEQLKVRRKQLGLSTGELADKIGCQRPLISMWEGNKSSPSGHFLVVLGEVLNMPPRTFFLIE